MIRNLNVSQNIKAIGDANNSDLGNKSIFLFEIPSHSGLDRHSVGTTIAGLMSAVQDREFTYKVIECQSSCFVKRNSTRNFRIKNETYYTGIVSISDEDNTYSTSFLPFRAPVIISSTNGRKSGNNCVVEINSEMLDIYGYVFDFLQNLKECQCSTQVMDNVGLQNFAMHFANDLLKASPSRSRAYYK